MYDVVALGEALIDFTYKGVSEGEMRLFEQNPGGAPANVLTALAKLGRKTAFIGKVGADIHGNFLIETMKRQNIDITGVVMDNDVFTTLAFVSINESGERTFSFSRKPGADTCLTAEELDLSLLKNTKVFHFGSLSLTDEPSRGATLKAVKEAKKAGAIISYDPNYRPLLWKSYKDAKEKMRAVIKDIDIIKISEEEIQLLTDETIPEKAAEALFNEGIKIVVITLGEHGAFIKIKDGLAFHKGYPAKVIDTTGAGDAFWGGFLYKLVESGKVIKDISVVDGEEFLKFGNAVASLCVEKRGAIPAMPVMKQIKERLEMLRYE